MNNPVGSRVAITVVKSRDTTDLQPRALMKFGEDFAEKYDLSSLKVLGTVGEPINPEAWIWYHKHVGSSQCSISDTYWQVQ